MVHALKRIHRSLRSGGVLLDLHPQPEPAGVEVWHEGQVERLGTIEDEEDSVSIEEARARLEEVEGDGWYVTERRMFFDLFAHFSTTQDWLEFRAREGSSSAVSAEVLATADRLLATGVGELVIREPIRASVLKRLT